MRSPVKKHKSLWLICLVLTMISGLAMADVSGQITGVRLDPEKGRIVILAKGNVGKHFARVIGKPNRLVMDFSDTGVSNVPAKIAGGTFDIREIRVGASKSRARVVVDFQNSPVPPFTVRRQNGEILVVLGKSLAGRLSAPQAPTGDELSRKAAPSSPLAPQLVKASAAASRNVDMHSPRLGREHRQIPVATNLPRMTQRGAKGEASLSDGRKLDLKTVKLAQRMDLNRPPSSQAVKSEPNRKESRGVLPARSNGPIPGSNGAPRRMVREVRPPVTPPTPDPRLLVQEITELKFVQVGHNARLVIRGGDKLDYRLNKVSPTKVRIDLINAEIPKAHQKALRTDLFSTSVEMIVPGSQSIFIQLKDSVPYQVQKKKGVLMVDFPPPRFNMLGAGSNERDTGGAATRIIQEEQIRKNMQNLNKSIENVQKEQEQLQKQRAEILKMYQATPDPEVFNKPVTLDFQGISLKNAFRLLAEQAGINIIVGGAAEGSTTLRLVDVPLGQVIDTLTTSYGLRRIMVGNVMRVGKAEEIKKWEDEKQKEYTTRIKEVDQRLEENSQRATKYQKTIEDHLSELKKLQETPVERSNAEDFGEAGCIFIRGEKVCFAYTTVRLTYASPRMVVRVLDCIFRLQCKGGTTGGTSTTTVSEVAGTSGTAAAQANRGAYAQQLADQGFTSDSPGGQARLQQYDETRARVQSADALTSAADTMASRRGGGVQISLPFGTDPVLARIIGYGMIWPDEDNRMIFIKDTPERIAQMKKLIFTLDTPSPQVQIESRLVQATRNWGRGLGIIWGGRNNQWGVLNSVAAETGWQQAYWGIGGNQAGPTANTPTGTTAAGNIPSSFAVNLPPSSISGMANLIGMGVQFGLLNLPAADMITELDLRLQLGEATGQTKTIARPKVTVMNKENATIKNGRTIAFSTVSASGTQTQLVNADLKLNVKPEVFSDGRIKMTVNVTDNDVGDIVNGQASLLTREASTVMVVKDGDTAVIGGIVRKTDNSQRQGFPGLMNIPVVNYLFSNKNRSKAITELLVFITPTIVRRPPPAS